MKKIIPILLVVGLVLSGLGAVATTDNTSHKLVVKSITFSEPILTVNEGYVSVSLKEATSNSMKTGEPILPQYSELFTFPRGTHIGSIDVTFSGIEQTVLSNAIRPAPAPVPLMDGATITPTEKNSEIYSSDSLYPSESWSYELKAGLHNGEQSVLVIVRCNPVRYSPAQNTIITSKSVEITVNYIPPEHPMTFDEEKDLVIIAPAEFETALQPLVDHKESHGVVTMFKSLEAIYDEYDGYDAQEDIKLFIYDMKETYNIQYALLVGGRDGQTFKWLLPERLTNNDDGWEAGYASDLYYSDIYKIEDNETVFENWDSNGNHVYAEWSNMIGKGDIIDYVPDVYVGRLACRNVDQVETVVDKIITYEKTPQSEKPWFDQAFVVGGDTFPPADGGATGWYEGEMENALTTASLESVGFTVEKLWTSLGTLTGPKDVQALYHLGAGFVHFAGHGNPMSWSTHPADTTEHGDWVNGITLKEIPKYRNGEMLPVVVIGGCHNGQFNVTMANFIKGLLTEGMQYFSTGDPIGGFWKKEWGPKDTIWGMVSQNGGGAIAGIAMTSLGYGYVNQDGTAGLGGWIDPHFFHSYAEDGYHILGQAHSETITAYITIIGNVNSDQIDRKTIEAWILQGDPSLMIGGYSE
jgi:hypothetical protein